MATATIRDVARRAQVSVASASRALNGHRSVTPAMRQRVLDAAGALDYVPHLGARSLSTRRTNMIGIVLPGLFDAVSAELVRGIDRAAHRHGLHLLLATLQTDFETSLAMVRALRGRVDGLLVMDSRLDAAILESHLPDSVPAVVIGDRCPSRGCATIRIDNCGGARIAVEHLVARGARRIAHIAGPAGDSDAAAREQGFREAVAALLGDTAPMIFRGDFGEESGAAAGRAFAERAEIDAIFAANDLMAIGCLASLNAAGIAVPDRVAVIGFDNLPVARYVSPALSTMSLDLDVLGERAVDHLVASIMRGEADPIAREPVVPGLIVRRSSDRPIMVAEAHS
jgi:LacI family transcriptional regulator